MITKPSGNEPNGVDDNMRSLSSTMTRTVTFGERQLNKIIKPFANKRKMSDAAKQRPPNVKRLLDKPRNASARGQTTAK